MSIRLHNLANLATNHRGISSDSSFMIKAKYYEKEIKFGSLVQVT